LNFVPFFGKQYDTLFGFFTMRISRKKIRQFAFSSFGMMLLIGCGETTNPIATPTVDPPAIPRSGQAHGLAHDRIDVPVSGAPLAVAHLVQGGLRAGHGSHFGFKSIVDSSTEAASERGFLYVAYGSALNAVTRRGQMLDRSRVHLIDETGAALELADRSVHFEPWSVLEQISPSGALGAEGEICTVATNVVMMQIRLSNDGSGPREVAPSLRFDCDPDPARERLDNYAAQTCHSYTLGTSEPGAVVVSVGGPASSHRVVWGEFEAGSESGRKELHFDATVTDDEGLTVRASSHKMYEGGTGTYSLYIAFGQSQEEAQDYQARFRNSPDAWQPRTLCQRQKVDFEATVANLPVLIFDRDKRVQKLAVDALMHARYAPRQSMGENHGLVAAKPLLVRFDGNEMARMLSVTHLFNADDPMEHIRLLLKASDQLGGRLPVEFDDHLQPLTQNESAAHPLLAWALAEVVSAHSGVYTVSQVDPLFYGAVQTLSFLENHRGKDVGFTTRPGEEGAWERSPRFAPYEDPSVRDVVDVIRTAWMIRSYSDLTMLAEAMGLDVEADSLRTREAEIRADLNAHFLHADLGLLTDRILREDDSVELSDVLTPALVVPAALGVADHTTVEASARFILDGNGLWGTWDGSESYMMAIPSVAYHDPWLNVEQDGYLLRGQVWPWQLYMAWRALVLAGYNEQAVRLKNRFLDMVDARSSEGIYQCYDFYDGRPGFGPQSPNEFGEFAPPVIQDAIIATVILRILHGL
jgi:hypothetical protein